MCACALIASLVLLQYLEEEGVAKLGEFEVQVLTKGDGSS
jgi:hypothetical protein